MCSYYCSYIFGNYMDTELFVFFIIKCVTALEIHLVTQGEIFNFFASAINFSTKLLHSWGRFTVYHSITLSAFFFCFSVHFRHFVTNASGAFSVKGGPFNNPKKYRNSNLYIYHTNNKLMMIHTDNVICDL